MCRDLARRRSAREHVNTKSKHLGDRGGPSRSRFSGSLSADPATQRFRVVQPNFQSFPTVLSVSSFRCPHTNIDRFLPTWFFGRTDPAVGAQSDRAYHAKRTYLGFGQAARSPRDLCSTTVVG